MDNLSRAALLMTNIFAGYLKILNSLLKSAVKFTALFNFNLCNPLCLNRISSYVNIIFCEEFADIPPHH